MATTMDQAVLILPHDYDEQSAFETPSRGYLSGACVRLPNGACHSVFFIDPTRLGQELADDTAMGRPFFAEQNLIVLNEVTESTMRAAVEELARQGFFQQLKPLP